MPPMAREERCLTGEELASLVAGALDPSELGWAEAHLARCSACRGTVADALHGMGYADSTAAVNAVAAGSTANDTLFPGDLVGAKYRIESRLGGGGMGEVFAARHLELGHRVAIKVLHPRVEDPNAKARFLHEARTCAGLASDHVLRVFDIGELPTGQPYLVMEFLIGEDLAAVVARGKLGVSEAVSFVVQACKGLAEVHARGIVHRDIKPANLFLVSCSGRRPIVKVLDFGLSKLFTSSAASTELVTGPAIVGSPLYMSPEQILAQEEIDARADVWALGVVLYELCTAAVPFRAAAATATLVAIATEPPTPPRALRPELPPALELVILRCLAKDREARYPSVDALAAALLPFASRLEEPRPGRHSAASATNVRRSSVTHNLPAQATPFVGREEELERLAGLLREPRIRLVTVLGPGGMGKSRLAVEAAHSVREGCTESGAGLDGAAPFPDGICFVQLAPIASADLVPSTVADAVGLRLHAAAPSKPQLLDFVRDKRLLLVLDNFEHLLPGARIIAELLEAAPLTKVLVTSRERLCLLAETSFELSGMSTPEREDGYEALDFGAPKLFVQIAQQRSPGFELGPGDLTHLARICCLVRGLPLGIVLAASWIETLPLEAIAHELAQSLDFLTSNLHDVPERQRSLGAVFESSWHLLGDDERRAFSELCVFRGGFTREAAQVVAGAGVRTLAALQGKSLIRRQLDTGRYEVHEVLRQYGEARLRQRAGAHEETLDRCAGWFAEFLGAWEEGLKSSVSPGALLEIAVEDGNLRAAFTWMLERRQYANLCKSIDCLHLYHLRRAAIAEGELAFRASIAALTTANADERDARRALGKSLTACAAYVRAGGRYAEAVTLLRRALDVLDAELSCDRAQALVELGTALRWAGHPEEAVVSAEEGVRLYRALDDPWGIVHALDCLGGVYGGYCGGTGDVARAEGAYRESLKRQTALDDGRAVQPATLTGLGFTLTRQGHYAEGCRLLLSALELVVKSGDVTTEMACELDLANAYRNLGDYVVAESYVKRCLELARRVGSWEVETWSHFQLGDIFKEQGLYAQARARYEQGLLRSVRMGDIGRVATAKLNLGDLALLDGRYEEAKLQLLASLEEFESVGETWGAVLALDNLGYVHCLEGDYANARLRFDRSLERSLAGRLFPYATNVVAGLGLLFARTEQGERAVELLSLAQSHPATERHTHVRRITPLLVELEARLPAATFGAAMKRGAALALESLASPRASGAA
jgi:serine/threonine protein kinase/predicted ATPase